MVEFFNIPLPLVFAVSVIGFIAAALVGRFFALKLRAREGGEPNLTTLHSAVLGMLALMNGFTFAMALSRHEGRRATLIEEANAISTAALRARLLPAPHDRESLELIQAYIEIRTKSEGVFLTREDLKHGVERAGELQESLWRIAMQVAAINGGPVPSAIYIDALNTMFDVQTTRAAAVVSHIPAVVLLAIYLIAVVSFGFTGYSNAVESRRLRASSVLMAVLISLVILLIHDLDRPRSGAIRVDRTPIIETAKAIESYLR